MDDSHWRSVASNKTMRPWLVRTLSTLSTPIDMKPLEASVWVRFAVPQNNSKQMGVPVTGKWSLSSHHDVRG